MDLWSLCHYVVGIIPLLEMRKMTGVFNIAHAGLASVGYLQKKRPATQSACCTKPNICL